MPKFSSPLFTMIVRLIFCLLLLTAVSACQQPTNSAQTAVSQPPSSTPQLPPPTTQSTPVTETASVTTSEIATETAVAYPVAPPPAYPATTAYPAPELPTATVASPVLPLIGSHHAYLPLVEAAVATPGPTATATLVPTPTPIATVDFTAVRAGLQAQGQEMGFAKIGFHVTLMEEAGKLDSWMQKLDAAGVPIFLKSVDNAEPLFKAQELMKQSGVAHVLVFRASGGVPNYDLPPDQAAQIHWQTHRALWPPELDPNLVWIETVNELDKNRADWLAQFALETARLALNDGFKWAAFGWASGEPEPEQWQSPAMLDFLRLAGANPDRLAIALHEYSYDKTKIGDQYPYKIGRFQELFRIADQYGIPRPTVLITEWGWEYKEQPNPEAALRDIAWAAKLYAAYPQVKGAAIWHLGVGCCFADISSQTERLIDPLTIYSLTNYFVVGETAVNPDAYRP